jgi:hypothetical protein
MIIIMEKIYIYIYIYIYIETGCRKVGERNKMNSKTEEPEISDCINGWAWVEFFILI